VLSFLARWALSALERDRTLPKESLMPEDQKEALKKIAEKLKATAVKVKKLKDDANSADAAMDQVEKENK
jgi:hypothetical protein